MFPFWNFSSLFYSSAFIFGLLAGYLQSSPPKVAVEVAASAQLAVEDEAPVLPDDFAKNDPPQVSADWKIQDPASRPSAQVDNRPEFLLFSTDGTWPCPACTIQDRELALNPPRFRWRKVLIPKDGPSPNGRAPVWQAPSKDPNQKILLTGNQTTLAVDSWARANGWDGSEASVPRPIEAGSNVAKSEVSIDGKSAKSILSAIAAHAKRMQDGPGELSGASGRSWLPEIDVDVSDSILAILDAMLSADGYSSGGLKVSWPAGVRSSSFDPPIQVRFKKILEVDVEIKSITVDGRNVTVDLTGRFLSQLKIKLK